MCEKEKELFKDMQAKLERLEAQLQNNELSHNEKESIGNQVIDCKKEVEKHIKYIAQGALIRSKATYYTQGEACTKYFFGLEKAKFNNKTLKAIKKEDGSITRDQKKILHEQAKFYRKLYAKRPDIKFIYENTSDQRLTELQKKQLDEPFTYDNFLASLMSMPHDKTPGIDGLSVEFYVIFHQKIGNCIWQAMLEANKNLKLHKSARRGVISLIPKKSRDPLLLKNWRPLTLLCVDHKIVTKMMVIRLKTVIDDIIGPQQTAYIPGRYIRSNIRKLIDLLMYLEQEEIPAILLTLDFEKCFDSVDHDALTQSLKYFNVGEYFISWVITMYEFELCVTNNGYYSEFFAQTHGVHQGCGFSGLGYLCVSEILAISLKNNAHVKGIQVGNNQELVSQYADDTSLLSKYEQESIQVVIDELEIFKVNTGLTVNYEKSKLYRVGAAKGKTEKFKLSKNFTWSTDTIDLLGILIDLDNLDDLENINYVKMIEKASQVTKTWYNRHLSLQGKVQIINTLISSLFIYRMQLLPLISKGTAKQINRIITEFIWNGRKPKIRNEMLMLKCSQGGRKLVDIVQRDASQKVSWVPRLIDTKDAVMKALAHYHINAKVSNELFWECNISKKDVHTLGCKSRYWQDLVSTWAKIHHYSPEEPEDIAKQVLWYNSFIKV